MEIMKKNKYIKKWSIKTIVGMLVSEGMCFQSHKMTCEELQEIKKEAMNEINRRLRKAKEIADAAEMLWVVLASVSGGDWSKQSKEWQEAAARWRDNYLKTVGKK